MRTPKTRPHWEPSRRAASGYCTPAEADDQKDIRRQVPIARSDQDTEHAVTALYALHYRSLVRLAALLVPDLAMAEEIVQDSFVAVHSVWRTTPDDDVALCYLRRSVIDRSRTLPRRDATAGTRAARPAPDMPGTGPSQQAGAISPESSAFVSALWALPARQREVLVLRYFADLSEPQIAAATGISKAAVRNHIARAVSALRAELPTAADR
jgi:RNA polymerase sigma-70 factor (sigma-E family)